MFVDVAQISVAAGKGGDGFTSFRKEIYVDRGGPDGGDGGRGGDVVFAVDPQLNTLRAFRYKKQFAADPGKAGHRQKKAGRSGEDLIIKVPQGTVVTNAETGELIADLSELGQTAVVAKGGKGGFGNAHFKSSTRQTPAFSELGDSGDELGLNLELKLLADVGLAGLPNAGKSTFISAVTNARPKIANYPFTTLVPNLGIADIDQDSLLIADIPGLIKGANQGKGLGHDFLRHVERTRVIAHLVDVHSEDLIDDIMTIRGELEQHNPDLLKRPNLVLLTKVEGVEPELIKDAIDQVKQHLESDIVDVMAISSTAQIGLGTALRQLVKLRDEHQPETEETDDQEPTVVTHSSEREWTIDTVRSNGHDYYRVNGPQIERFARQTDMDNFEGLARLEDILRKRGILIDLQRRGWDNQSPIYIGPILVEF